MLRVVSLISVICSPILIPQVKGFCETPSGSQTEIQELRDKNQDLQAVANW